MDFDFKHITLPFRMRPGLRRLDAGAAHFNLLDPQGVLAAEKRVVIAAGEAVHTVPGFDAAPALRAARASATASASESACTGGIALQASDPPAGSRADAEQFALQVEEDIAVLDGATGAVPWLCVCVPSHWSPQEKVGLSLAQIHGPVADNAALLAASRQLVAMVTQGGHWERFVWTVTPSPRHDQHPRRAPRMLWPETDDPAGFAAQCFLRAERQTFLPVTDAQGAATGQAVFTIRVMLSPLAQVVDSASKAQRMHASLDSMSDAVLSYKNLADAKLRLLAWLALRTA